MGTPKPLELKNPTSVLCRDQLKNLNSVKRAKSNDRLEWTHRFIFSEIYPGQGQNYAQKMAIFGVNIAVDGYTQRSTVLQRTFVPCSIFSPFHVISENRLKIFF